MGQSTSSLNQELKLIAQELRKTVEQVNRLNETLAGIIEKLEEEKPEYYIRLCGADEIIKLSGVRNLEGAQTIMREVDELFMDLCGDYADYALDKSSFMTGLMELFPGLSRSEAESVYHVTEHCAWSRRMDDTHIWMRPEGDSCEFMAVIIAESPEALEAECEKNRETHVAWARKKIAEKEERVKVESSKKT
jgi:molybdopterin converting factor small subunit